MKYISTSQESPPVSAREAIINGLAPDGGLYLPEQIPVIEPSKLAALLREDFSTLSLHLLEPYLGADIPLAELERLVRSAFDFPVPLRRIEKSIFALELFHGPTFAFKDFGARFLARAMSYFRRSENRELTVLVATSGDTGSAVASGFLRVPGIRVVILYPRGKVSRLQEQQLTTLGENISALEVEGTFDDCQRLVKGAFLDRDVRSALDITSANSINIGRLLPQLCYYASGYGQLPVEERHSVIVSVPSGNLGNLTAGFLALRMGIPFKAFVAALNRNRTFADFLQTEKLAPRPSLQTISNAMDVGDPSNAVRLLKLYGDTESESAKALTAVLSAESFDDEETLAEIRSVHQRTAYVLDPHGAVGLLGLRRRLGSGQTGIFLETAHPGKFTESVEKAIGTAPELPPELAACLAKPKKATLIPAEAGALKGFLLS